MYTIYLIDVQNIMNTNSPRSRMDGLFLPVLLGVLEEYWFRSYVYRVLNTLGSLALCTLFVGRQYSNNLI